jgi:hypothetical protein
MVDPIRNPGFISDEEVAAMDAAQTRSPGFISDAQMAQMEREEAASRQNALTPSWGDAFQQGGKNTLTGIAKTIGTIADYNPFNPNSTGPRMLVNALLGSSDPSLQSTADTLSSPIDESIQDTIKGPAADFVKSAQEASVFPGGSPLLNALSGIGSTAGEKLFPNSKIAPLIGSIVAPTAAGATGKLAKSLGSKLPKYAQGAEDMAFGVNTVDRKNMLEGPAKEMFAKGEAHPTTKALETAKRYGLDSSLDRQELMVNTKTKIEDLRIAIRELLTDADAVLPGKVPLKFPKSEKFLNGIKTSDKESLFKEFEKAKGVLDESLDGTLNSLQDAKVQYNEMKFTPETTNARKILNNKMTQDLKEIIENNVDDLANKGKISEELAGEIKKMNRDEGDLISLMDPFLRNANADIAPNWANKAIKFIRSTGGGGVPLLAGAYYGMLPQAALATALATYATTPHAAYGTSKLLRAAAPKLSQGGSALTNASSPLAAALIALQR